jgi:hypothetical protein
MPRQVTPSRPNGIAHQRRCPASTRRRLTDELTPPAASALARMGMQASGRSRAQLPSFVRGERLRRDYRQARRHA